MPIYLSKTGKQIFKTQKLEKKEQTKPKASRTKKVIIRVGIPKNRE